MYKLDELKNMLLMNPNGVFDNIVVKTEQAPCRIGYRSYIHSKTSTYSKVFEISGISAYKCDMEQRTFAGYCEALAYEIYKAIKNQ